MGRTAPRGAWDGVFLLFCSYGAGETRNKPVGFGEHLHQPEGRGMFVHRYGMARAANPPKTLLGDNGNTHGSTAPGGKGKGPGTRSTWELLWEDTEQSDPLGMSWIDPCRAGILPSASGCSSPSKHGEDPRKTQSWEPLLTATTHNRSCCRCLRRSGSCSLPPEWFIAGLLSPPRLRADTTEAFSHVL